MEEWKLCADEGTGSSDKKFEECYQFVGDTSEYRATDLNYNGHGTRKKVSEVDFVTPEYTLWQQHLKGVWFFDWSSEAVAFNNPRREYGFAFQDIISRYFVVDADVALEKEYGTADTFSSPYSYVSAGVVTSSARGLTGRVYQLTLKTFLGTCSTPVTSSDDTADETNAPASEEEENKDDKSQPSSSSSTTSTGSSSLESKPDDAADGTNEYHKKEVLPPSTQDSSPELTPGETNAPASVEEENKDDKPQPSSSSSTTSTGSSSLESKPGDAADGTNEHHNEVPPPSTRSSSPVPKPRDAADKTNKNPNAAPPPPKGDLSHEFKPAASRKTIHRTRHAKLSRRMKQIIRHPHHRHA